MKFNDSVYGEQEVEKQVLKELIRSRPVQRLKKIHQAGPTPFFIEDKPAVTRFQHSLGVFFLLRKFDASIEEQIAGLLHDVPHTAFSHVADFVFENDGHEYHERFMKEIIHDSEIPVILDEHGYKVEYILDEENFGMLERPLPALCADRIDYAVRDLQAHFGYDMKPFIENLDVSEGEFVFRHFEKAREFADFFMELDSNVYASPLEVAIHEVFADIIREALATDELTEEDLFGTDRELMAKLRSLENRKVQERFMKFDRGLEIQTGVSDYDLHVHTKARAVDPKFLDNGEKRQASQRSKELKNAIEDHNERICKGFRIKIKS